MNPKSILICLVPTSLAGVDVVDTPVSVLGLADTTVGQ